MNKLKKLLLISSALLLSTANNTFAGDSSATISASGTVTGTCTFTASAMAFAHGSNDVANAIGPVSAIISVASEGSIGSKASVNSWVLLLGGIGIVFGLAMLGGKVIKTVGTKITTLTPSLGFSAEMAAASTVVAATYLGFPISTTHTLVGAVIGVGLAKGVSHIDLNSIGRIVLSWLITIPIGASLTILFYVILRIIFGV